YQARQALHVQRHPDYNAWWDRPTKATAEAVWELLHKALKIQLSHLAADNLTAMQTLVVGLDLCVRVSEEKRTKKRKDQNRQMITQIHLLDALALRWSDWFRQWSTEGHRTPQ